METCANIYLLTMIFFSMVEKDFKEFVADLCSDISWKDLLKKWGANIGALIPYANQYFTANMSSFEHDMQLRAIKKLVDGQDDLKNLLQEHFEDFLNVVRKHERATYPFKIFNISQIEDIQGELNWNPEFVKEYLPLREVEDISLDKNILLKGKIGIGKTRSIFRLMKRINIETVIVVTEYVRTLGVDRFENLDFQDEAILIWDDIQNSYEEFLKALPYLKTKNILIVAAIRSTDYEKIEKDVNIRERRMFTEIDLELYQKERMEQFVRLCEREFQETLTDSLREALVQKAVSGDCTPLYVASIFVKEKQITENIIDELPEDVVRLWAGYFKELTSNEKCFMKALAAAKLGFSPPFRELIEELYTMAFFGESRDFSDTVASLKREHWIVEIPDYYDCLDAQLECFRFEEVDTKNFLKCLFEKKLILEYHLQLLLGIGSHFYKSRHYDLAIKLMNRALELMPDFAQAYRNRGIAYSEKGEFDLAIKDYNEAIKLDPDYAEAYYKRGNAYCEKGEFDLAITDYNDAIKLDPNYAEVYINRGNAHDEKGEFDLAITDYNDAIKLKPDYAEVFSNRGLAYYKKGDVELAFRDFEKCAILFLTKGVILNAIYRFVHIFKLIFETESHEILCVECGLIAVFLMDKSEGKVNSLEILKTFNYDNLESFLNDIYQQKGHLISSYSRALLHNLYKTHIDENAKRSEFLSNEDIALVDKIPKEDTKELFEEIKEDREKIILVALLDRMNNPVNGESS